MIDIICLNEKFSTTKNLFEEKPLIYNKLQNKFESALFLSKNEGRIDEDGLREKDYFKKSYKAKPLISIVTVV